MLLDRGIERVYEVASFPTGVIPEKFEKEFSAMCEFLAFDEGIRLPFFKILNNAVERKYVALLNTFEPKKVVHILTHKETFSFLCLLGHRKTREILEASNLPSNIFNSLLKSVEEKNVDVFDRSLSKGDFSEFLKKLWMLRYVVLGINQPTTIMGYRVSRENRWISEHPCHFCFNRYTTKGWERCKENTIKTLAGINVRPRRPSKVSRIGEKDDVLNKNILSSEDTIVSGKYYPAWIEGLKNNDSRYGQYNKDIELYDISSLTSRCADMIYGMLTAVGKANTESVSSLFGVEKASIHYEEHDYFCDDIDDYLIYILFFTHRMLEIYRYVKDVLEKDEKDCLLSLMKHSVYTYFVCGEVINAVELEPTKLQKHFNSSDQPLSPPQDEKVAESEPSSDENDRNGDENKWTNDIVKGETIDLPDGYYCRIEPQTDDNFKKLFDKLKEYDYIAGDTQFNTFKTAVGYIRKGIDKKIKNYLKVVWKVTYLGRANWKSLLNLLILLGIPFEELTVEIINQLFVHAIPGKLFDSKYRMTKKIPNVYASSQPAIVEEEKKDKDISIYRQLKRLIEESGFTINNKNTELYSNFEKKNFDQVRAMLIKTEEK
jgi:hypothetical protein